jgi:hypothetical protein
MHPINLLHVNIANCVSSESSKDALKNRPNAWESAFVLAVCVWAQGKMSTLVTFVVFAPGWRQSPVAGLDGD